MPRTSRIGDAAHRGASASAAFGFLTLGLSLAGVLALVFAISAGVSLVRNAELSRAAKAMWLLIVVLFPIFGSVVYFGVRSDW
jgi:hypothetical protein